MAKKSPRRKSDRKRATPGDLTTRKANQVKGGVVKPTESLRSRP